jgi:hypothetical protein
MQTGDRSIMEGRMEGQQEAGGADMAVEGIESAGRTAKRDQLWMNDGSCIQL